MNVSRHGVALILLLIFVLTSLSAAVFYYRQPYIKHFKYGSITVHQVQHNSNVNAEFVVVTEIYGKTIVEIIREPGVPVERLEDQAAIEFLANFIG